MTAGRRAALVVAAYEFQDPKFQVLRSPARDAEALAEVLADPKIGMFEVTTLVNQPCDLVTQELEGFFADRKRDDLLTVYFSCHGVKDSAGRLYFAMANTKFNRLGSTGIPASFLSDQMEYSYSKRIVLLLDCCYSGAFLKGLRPRATDDVHVEGQLEGRGRAVITASRATEYAFEAEHLTLDKSRPSLFTGAIVEGLSSGKADRDGDGSITVDELYDYVYDHVRQNVSAQTPGKWAELEGELVLARNPSPPIRAAELPTELVRAIESESALQRLGVVAVLVEWLQEGSPSESLRAKNALSALSDDPDVRVSRAAKMALANVSVRSQPAKAATPPAAPESTPPSTPPERTASAVPPLTDEASPSSKPPVSERVPERENLDAGPPRPHPGRPLDDPAPAAAKRPSEDGTRARVSRAAALPLLAGPILLVLALFPDFWMTAGGWISLSSVPRQTTTVAAFSALILGVAFCLLLRGPASVAALYLLMGIAFPVMVNLLSLLAHLNSTGDRVVYQRGPGYYLAVAGFGTILLGAAVAILSGRHGPGLAPFVTARRAVAWVVSSALAALLLIAWGPLNLAGGGFNLLVLVVIGLVASVWLFPPYSSAARHAVGARRARLAATALLLAIPAGLYIAGSTPMGMHPGGGAQVESAALAAYVVGAAVVLVLTIQLRPPAAGEAVALGFLLASGTLNAATIFDPAVDAAERRQFGILLLVGVVGALASWSLRQWRRRAPAASASSASH